MPVNFPLSRLTVKSYKISKLTFIFLLLFNINNRYGTIPINNALTGVTGNFIPYSTLFCSIFFADYTHYNIKVPKLWYTCLQ